MGKRRIKDANRCNVCGCMPNATGGCTIRGRIYVGTMDHIVGVTPPCPFIELGHAKFDVVDAYWHGGCHEDENGKKYPNMELGEHVAAIEFAKLLGVHGQDFRTTGLGEDDGTTSAVIGGDSFRDACRAYCVPELHQDSE